MMRSFSCRSLSALILLPLLGMLAGCQNAQVGHPLTEKLSGNDLDSQLGFWHSLAERHVTSNDEAFHGLLLYVDGKDDSADYSQRVALLKSRGMLPANFSGPSHQAVDRGILAVCIVKVLNIKGGLFLHLFPQSQRYAVRELVFDGVYPTSSPNQTFSGTEFVGVVGKMEDYQRTAGASSPVEEAPAISPPPPTLVTPVSSPKT